jgi:hypothetical protein
MLIKCAVSRQFVAVVECVWVQCRWHPHVCIQAVVKVGWRPHRACHRTPQLKHSIGGHLTTDRCVRYHSAP